MGRETEQTDLRIPAEYNLLGLKILMRAAMTNAYQRRDSEYLEHLSMVMLDAVKGATSIRDVIVDGGRMIQPGMAKDRGLSAGRPRR